MIVLFNKIIQNEVLRQQAVELGIEPSMDEIEADVKWKIEILQSEQNDVSEYVNGCLVGSGMTMEEYADKQIEEAYLSKQREELWRVIIANEGEEIEKEAVERKVSVQEAEKEYFEKYVENLVSKADIEYLDDNLEQLME